MAGIVLADEMLAAVVPADDLIKLLEPSPIQKLKALSILKRLFTNEAKQIGRDYWRDKIEDLSFGMGSRTGIKYNFEFMNRYRKLPRE